MRDKSRHSYRHREAGYPRPLGVWGRSARSYDHLRDVAPGKRKALWFTGLWSAISAVQTLVSAFCARFRHNQRHNADTVAGAHFVARVGLAYCAAEFAVAVMALVAIALAGAP